MPSVSAVLFDFGKVLSGPPDARVWAAMHELLGTDVQTFDTAYWAHRDAYDEGLLTGEAYWNAVAGTATRGLTPEARRQLIALDTDLWTKMNEPMLAWVSRLHAAGVRTGILSNMGDAMEAGIRAKFDWIGRFDHTVWSHRLRLRKPDAAIYHAASEGLRLPPRDILFIDDKSENVRGAEAAGMQGIAYSDHASFELELRRRELGWLLHPDRQPSTKVVQI